MTLTYKFYKLSYCFFDVRSERYPFVENGHLMMGVDWAHVRRMRLISKKPLLNKGLEL